MEKMSVDDFLVNRVLPEFRPVVEKIREVMRECAPEAQVSIVARSLPPIVGWIFTTHDRVDVYHRDTRLRHFE